MSRLFQPVALKFLPPGFEANAERLRRFLGEVRTARQVSHSNVCPFRHEFLEPAAQS